jgi:hypothetical protein
LALEKSTAQDGKFRGFYGRSKRERADHFDRKPRREKIYFFPTGIPPLRGGKKMKGILPPLFIPGTILAFYAARRSRGIVPHERGNIKLIGKWTPPTHRIGQKGGANGYYILVGVFIALGFVVAMNYYHDRNNDFTIHVPQLGRH